MPIDRGWFHDLFLLPVAAEFVCCVFGSSVLSMGVGPKERAILAMYVWIEAERMGSIPLFAIQTATHGEWLPEGYAFEQLRATAPALNYVLLRRHHNRELRKMASQACSSSG